MGNHTVENLFMGEFARVSGTFSHVQSRSKYDHYKQLLRLTFNDVTISCIENPDYWESGLKIGEDVRRALTKTESVLSFFTCIIPANNVSPDLSSTALPCLFCIIYLIPHGSVFEFTFPISSRAVAAIESPKRTRNRNGLAGAKRNKKRSITLAQIFRS